MVNRLSASGRPKPEDRLEPVLKPVVWATTSPVANRLVKYDATPDTAYINFSCNERYKINCAHTRISGAFLPFNCFLQLCMESLVVVRLVSFGYPETSLVGVKISVIFILI